ncbi:unnamed protein product [Thlaspi arvense]|uniref:Uncharacterized protein n=1 Tax=Thlaspi arvense TaxID=13288 RepID=A0AAU9SIV7_THLAR|nr:unnamed protein product [Thlaspi arvense]
MVIPTPPPRPPPKPLFRGFRLTGHHIKKGFDKDKLRMYLLRVKNENQESERVNQDHKLLPLSKITRRPDQDQNGHTRSKPGTVEVVEGSGSGTIPHEWVISISEKLEQANRDDDRTSRGKLCIYKVQYYLHEKDNKSYFPQTVSLGPYHHGEKQTQSMECHKWRAVNKVLKRSKQGIEVFIDAMIELEERVRACYEGPINLNSYEFTEMLVLDGCFVLELLRGVEEGFSKLGYDRNDPVFAIRGSMHSIQRDMIMLENQLPLVVLNRLLELQNQTGSVAQLAVRFFDPLMPTAETSAENSLARGISIDPSTDLGELHCLDVFRRSLLFPRPEPKTSGKKMKWGSRVADKRLQQIVPTVTELRDAGFQFKRRKTDRFWDIKFNNGYLEIPSLHIHESTKSLFLNLIAFEQCHTDSSNDITSYIIFMDSLIDSPEDVSYLHQCGIIEHSLGSYSDVANVFNQLCQEVVFNTNDIYLSQVLTEVLQCYNQNFFRKWNAWKSTLKHKYFDSPWAYFSFFAAVILLVLTLSQTYFAGYEYFS